MGPFAAARDAPAGRYADHDVIAGQAAVAAGPGLHGDGTGLPMGRAFKAAVLQRSLTAGISCVIALIGWARGLGSAGSPPSHREHHPQLDVAADAARAGHQSVGILLASRPHDGDTRPDACDRRLHHRDPGRLAAARRFAWSTAPFGGFSIALGLTVLLFPVVQPWLVLWRSSRCGLGHPPRIPHHDNRGHAHHRHLRPERRRRRFALFQILLAVVADKVIVVS